MLSRIRSHWMTIVRSIVEAMGALWLLLEAYQGLTTTQSQLPFLHFILLSAIGGGILFFVDGCCIGGFLKNRVEVKINGFDTKISIIFGDLFEKNGWKAVGVNDFFDSIVDDNLVSSNSLHGHVINTYWPNDRVGWQDQVDQSLASEQSKTVDRKKGNARRFPIGTAATATNGDQKFIFVALGKTDTSNNVTTASAESLICSVRGLLCKARAVCAGDALYIPLMGSGLGRVGIKNAILVDLILAAIIEETKASKITDSITIVLPKEKLAEISLASFPRDWN